ncbi:unnamed protein product [Amoebophrya sp. A120]|nr:unnamed protein product [Amoebophrya sp. A120]|eukprot:GSA120T00008903001.1
MFDLSSKRTSTALVQLVSLLLAATPHSLTPTYALSAGTPGSSPSTSKAGAHWKAVYAAGFRAGRNSVRKRQLVAENQDSSGDFRNTPASPQYVHLPASTSYATTSAADRPAGASTTVPYNAVAGLSATDPVQVVLSRPLCTTGSRLRLNVGSEAACDEASASSAAPATASEVEVVDRFHLQQQLPIAPKTQRKMKLELLTLLNDNPTSADDSTGVVEQRPSFDGATTATGDVSAMPSRSSPDSQQDFYGAVESGTPTPIIMAGNGVEAASSSSARSKASSRSGGGSSRGSQRGEGAAPLLRGRDNSTFQFDEAKRESFVNNVAQLVKETEEAENYTANKQKYEDWLDAQDFRISIVSPTSGKREALTRPEDTNFVFLGDIEENSRESEQERSKYKFHLTGLKDAAVTIGTSIQTSLKNSLSKVEKERNRGKGKNQNSSGAALPAQKEKRVDPGLEAELAKRIGKALHRVLTDRYMTDLYNKYLLQEVYDGKPQGRNWSSRQNLMPWWMMTSFKVKIETEFFPRWFGFAEIWVDQELVTKTGNKTMDAMKQQFLDLLKHALFLFQQDLNASHVSAQDRRNSPLRSLELELHEQLQLVPKITPHVEKKKPARTAPAVVEAQPKEEVKFYSQDEDEERNWGNLATTTPSPAATRRQFPSASSILRLQHRGKPHKRY